MAKISKRVVEYYSFYCYGCKHEHNYAIYADGTQWHFNGDIENPTFTPSLLNRNIDKDGNVISVCHLFITNGQIVYCGDCTHEMAGKTMAL